MYNNINKFLNDLSQGELVKRKYNERSLFGRKPLLHTADYHNLEIMRTEGVEFKHIDENTLILVRRYDIRTSLFNSKLAFDNEKRILKSILSRLSGKRIIYYPQISSRIKIGIPEIRTLIQLQIECEFSQVSVPDSATFKTKKNYEDFVNSLEIKVPVIPIIDLKYKDATDTPTLIVDKIKSWKKSTDFIFRYRGFATYLDAITQASTYLKVHPEIHGALGQCPRRVTSDNRVRSCYERAREFGFATTFRAYPSFQNDEDFEIQVRQFSAEDGSYKNLNTFESITAIRNMPGDKKANAHIFTKLEEYDLLSRDWQTESEKMLKALIESRRIVQPVSSR